MFVLRDFETMAAALALTSFLVGARVDLCDRRTAAQPRIRESAPAAGIGIRPAIPAVCPASQKAGRKRVQNRPDETISRNPRNHPETDGAYISGHQMAHRRLGGIT